jgi:hypothetical protein
VCVAWDTNAPKREMTYVMKDWTEDDSNALFRNSSDAPADDRAGTFDGSEEAMRRLRFPFEVNPADVVEQQQEVADDEDDYRR